MKLASQLEAVTVYARGAVCERVVTVPAGAGPRLTITGLPLSLRPASVRARTRGTGTTAVLEVRPGFSVALSDPIDASAEQKALEAAQAELARLQLAVARVQKELDDVAELAPAYQATKKGDPPREAAVEATLALAGFVGETLPALQAEKRALDEKLEDAGHEVRLRHNRLAEAASNARRSSATVERTAEVALSSAPTQPVTLVIEYQVSGARWAPAYELQLGAGLVGGTLSMRAAVAQYTGEDWVGVKLSLSTADLDRRIDKPVLRSIRIGRSQPPAPRSGWREVPPGLEALFADFDALGAPRHSAPPVGGKSKPSGRASRNEPVKDARITPAGVASRELAKAMLPQAASAPMDALMEEEPMPPAPPMRAAATGAFRGMPAPGAAPAPLAKMARRRGGASRADLDEGGAPEMEMSASMVFGGAPDSLGAGGGAYSNGAPPPEPPAPELTVDGALLDYDLLRMPGPGESRRGRLQPGSVLEVQALALSVQVDVLMAVVTLHEQRAQSVERLVLPPHARAPRESAGTFDYRYGCKTPVDVPSVAAWRVLPVATADVSIAAEYQCVPSVEPKVYRTVNLKNRSEHAMLAGPVDVFVGGGFLLTAQLPTLPPSGDGETLGLGVEEAIKVARNTAFRETTGGLLGGSTVLPHEISIDVENRTGRPATIEVRERVPVTTDDDVKIEEIRVEPMWKKDEALRDGQVVRGARSWRVTLAAGEKKNLVAEFNVKMPSSKMLQGGNRRV